MLKSSNNIYLVYEFLNGGSLAKILEERSKLPEKEAISVFIGVLKYINYCIIIEDLKLYVMKKSFIVI